MEETTLGDLGVDGMIILKLILEQQYEFLSGSLKVRDHFRRPRRRWEDNIKTDLRETVEILVGKLKGKRPLQET
jgi:hypothetical protein